MKRPSLRYCALSAIMVSAQYQRFMKIVSNSATDSCNHNHLFHRHSENMALLSA
jgi:hypothetical protein